MNLVIRTAKLVSSTSLVVAIGLIAWSLVFAQVIRPYEIHQSINEGCREFRIYDTNRSLSKEELANARRAFTRLAQLDPRYIDLSTASVLNSYRSIVDSGQSVDISIRLKILEAESLLQGFCAVRIKINSGINPNELVPVK